MSFRIDKFAKNGLKKGQYYNYTFNEEKISNFGLRILNISV